MTGTLSMLQPALKTQHTIRLAFVTIGLMLFACSANAGIWTDLWQRPDQQGTQALKHNQPARAAQLFHSSAWRGYADYRAKHYRQAVKQWQTLDSARANYNRGNALAQLGHFQKAIDAYTRALKKQPKFADAQYNKTLLENYLKTQKQRQRSSAKQSSPNTKANKHAQKKTPSHAPSSSQKQQKSKKQQQQQQQQQQQKQANRGQTKASSQSKQRSSRSNQTITKIQNKASSHAARTKPTQQPTPQQWRTQQWLKQIPDDPGGLLRQKFWRDYQRRRATQEDR